MREGAPGGRLSPGCAGGGGLAARNPLPSHLLTTAPPHYRTSCRTCRHTPISCLLRDAAGTDAFWWLNWDREYAAWKAAGLKVGSALAKLWVGAYRTYGTVAAVGGYRTVGSKERQQWHLVLGVRVSGL